ncbi:MAG: nucleoside-diphosphate kinase, partial [Gemmatimonadetes bacterium]|nr:nucleoside-diphosphate kinase [Gemmatimonadota bacterium]
MLTLAIIKPDAVGSGLAGKIIAHLEAQGFVVQAVRMTRLSKSQ